MLLDWSALAAGGAGVAVGIGVSVGVGPVNALCLRQTLHAGWRAGVAAGAGALLADTFYGASAVFGMSLAAQWVDAHANTLRVVAALVLIGIAIFLIAVRPHNRPGEGDPRASLRGFATSFALTISNPLPILTIAALLAALGASGLAERQPLAASVGIAMGCALWWLSLTTVVARLRERFSNRVLHRVHVAVAILMIALAVGLLFQASGAL